MYLHRCINIVAQTSASEFADQRRHSNAAGPTASLRFHHTLLHHTGIHTKRRLTNMHPTGTTASRHRRLLAYQPDPFIATIAVATTNVATAIVHADSFL